MALTREKIDEWKEKIVAKNSYTMLRKASYEVCNNSEIMLEALKNHDSDFLGDIIGMELLNDKNFMLSAVKIKGKALYWGLNRENIDSEFKEAMEGYRKDPNILTEAVKQDGHVLIAASKEFQNSPDIVMEAVKQKGFALQYAGLDVRDNKEVVMEAVKQNGLALQFASERLKKDPDIAKEAIGQDKLASFYVNDESSIEEDKGDKVEYFIDAFKRLNAEEKKTREEIIANLHGENRDPSFMEEFYSKKNIVGLEFINSLNTDNQFRQRWLQEYEVEYEEGTEFFYDKIFINYGEPNKHFTILPPSIYETNGRLSGKNAIEKYLMDNDLRYEMVIRFSGTFNNR